MPDLIALNTTRLELVSAGPDMLRAAIAGDKELIALTGFSLAAKWTMFGPGVFEYVLEILGDKPDAQAWWTWFPVHENMLIGNCGYKGPPDDQGRVEIGYEVAPNFRGQGFATEIAKALIKHAWQENSVNVIIAHTLPEHNASTRVLKKCGFSFVETVEDPEDGVIWKWQLQRTES